MDKELGYEIFCDHQDKDFSSFNAQIDSGRHIGFINTSRLMGMGMAEIMVLTVDPEFRRKRVGTGLLRQAESWAKEQGSKYMFMFFAGCDFIAMGFLKELKQMS